MNLHAVLKLLLVRRQGSAGILAGNNACLCGCRQRCRRYKSTRLADFEQSMQEHVA